MSISDAMKFAKVIASCAPYALLALEALNESLPDLG